MGCGASTNAACTYEECYAIDDEYVGLLGRGQYGVVAPCVRLSDMREFAVKRVTLKRDQTEDHRALLRREIDALRRLHHSNILPLIASFEGETHFHIVSQLLTGGELYTHLNECDGLSQTECAKVMHGMCSGIAHMQELGIVHRDLKPDNLLYSSHTEDARVVIIDFGLARMKQGDRRMTICGSLGYGAPEVSNGAPVSINNSDNWSAGVVLFEAAFATHPFTDASYASLENYKREVQGGWRFSIVDGQGDGLVAGKRDAMLCVTSGGECVCRQVERVTRGCRDMIVGLMERDPSKRMSMQQVLEHPWVEDSWRNALTHVLTPTRERAHTDPGTPTLKPALKSIHEHEADLRMPAASDHQDSPTSVIDVGNMNWSADDGASLPVVA